MYSPHPAFSCDVFNLFFYGIGSAFHTQQSHTLTDTFSLDAFFFCSAQVPSTYADDGGDRSGVWVCEVGSEEKKKIGERRHKNIWHRKKKVFAVVFRSVTDPHVIENCFPINLIRFVCFYIGCSLDFSVAIGIYSKSKKKTKDIHKIKISIEYIEKDIDTYFTVLAFYSRYSMYTRAAFILTLCLFSLSFNE